MATYDQILSIHLGQGGIQIGSAFWELICLEHGIGPDGEPLITEEVVEENDNKLSLFDIGNRGSYIPRSIFIDSEASVINDIKTGAYRDLFNRTTMLNQIEDAANNYARGSYTVGSKMIGSISETIRKVSEHTDNLRNFFFFHTTGGGTGSGLCPLILLTLQKNYPKITKMSMSVIPGNNYVSAIVEPYNMMLQGYASVETLDINYLFENESMFNICTKKLFINSPSFTDINRILALIISSMSSPVRYSSTLRSSIDDMLTNLIPYPRIHYPIIRYAPINHISRTEYNKVTTSELTKELFSNFNQSTGIDTNRGLFMALVINYQGLVNGSEIYTAIEREKSKTQFVEWSPTGFKVGICNQMPTMSPLSLISPTDQAATMIINTTAISALFKSLGRKFDHLFEKKSFVHWFIGEGMEEMEFMEARDETDLLVEDLNEIEMTETEILNAPEPPPNKKGRSISIRQAVDEENNDDDENPDE